MGVLIGNSFGDKTQRGLLPSQNDSEEIHLTGVNIDAVWFEYFFTKRGKSGTLALFDEILMNVQLHILCSNQTAVEQKEDNRTTLRSVEERYKRYQ